jgi:hypothetical protein
MRQSKVIVGAQFGPRTQARAHAITHAPVKVLAPGCVPLFTSEGLDLCVYALTAHFGQWVNGASQKERRWQVNAELLCGQLQKTYRRRKLMKTERRMRWDTWEAFKAKIKKQRLSNVLNTAFVEWVKRTIRRGIAVLQRRSWSTTQTQQHLVSHFQCWRAFYHFVRSYGSLRERLGEAHPRVGRQIPQQYRKRTPATLAPCLSRDPGNRGTRDPGRAAQVHVLRCACLTIGGLW